MEGREFSNGVFAIVLPMVATAVFGLQPASTVLSYYLSLEFLEVFKRSFSHLSILVVYILSCSVSKSN